MNIEALIDSMDRFPEVLTALVRGMPVDDARFKSDEKNWSILEVVRHIGDEEVDDFRRRVDLTLHHPGEPWPPIDPEGWARERKYNDDDLGEALDRFVAERRASIEWLRGLVSPDWDASYEHPKVGPMKAGDIMASWAAHDQLHLRQIAKRRFELIGKHAGPYDTAYAGPW